MSEWLSLAAAAELLGVHPNTLRRWSRAGRVPSQRTPGGHRRFERAALDAWLARRAGAPLAARPPAETIGWRQSFEGELLREIRELGQRLLGLLLQFLSRPDEDPRYLDESRAVGRVYGAEAARAGLTMVQVMEAFLHFRARFTDMALRLPAFPQSSDEEALRRLHKRFDRFMDEVLLGTVEGYSDAEG